MYAQLDFTNNRYKRVNLIGGPEVGIIPKLISMYPNDFVGLKGREDIPLDTSDWHYDTEEDVFLTTAQLPVLEPEPVPVEPYQPTSAEVVQAISDLQADLIIAGVIE